jgi:peptidoglycan hydrolase-like protein with peptidoglycan-binding domain
MMKTFHLVKSHLISPVRVLPLLLLCTAPAMGLCAPVLAQSSSSILQENDSGQAIAELQERLLDLGYYNGEITGFYGSATKEAVAQFQRDVGLTADGIVGASTEAALRNPTNSSDASASSAPRSFIRLGDSGEQVAELQRRLTELGYYTASVSASFDGATEAAVLRFQQDNNLLADGIVGSETALALRQPSGQPAPTAINSGNRAASVLRLGDSGAAVSELQGRLSELGFYQSPITGNYDAQTQSAVLAFQRSRNLTPDGIAGSQVATALGLNSSNSSGDMSWRQIQQARAEVQQARTEAEQAKQAAEQAQLEAEQARLVLNQNLQEGRYSVAELQRHLQINGYDPGSINGILTAETRNAITEAQRQYGLTEADLFDNF